MSTTITTIDDSINEGPQGFLLQLKVTDINTADMASGVDITRNGVALVTINDDDGEGIQVAIAS